MKKTTKSADAQTPAAPEPPPIEIKHRWTGGTLFSLKVASLRLAVQAAVKAGANLRDANLCGANLCGANLCGADLRGANLCGADLCGANLRGANLCGADLCDADLCGADLRGADLRGANLCDADLCGADLRGANLRDANLRGADLRGANLCGADLRDAKNAELAIAMTRILPAGELTGWKKCRQGRVVELLIPREAKRSHAFGRKCRAEYAQVVAILDEGGKPAEVAVSLYNDSFSYRVGETIRPTNGWDANWQDECSAGIHFFITREEALAYQG